VAFEDRDRRRTDLDFDANPVLDFGRDALAGPREDLADVMVGNDDPRTLTPLVHHARTPL
jgi:hypothetical protein